MTDKEQTSFEYWTKQIIISEDDATSFINDPNNCQQAVNKIKSLLERYHRSKIKYKGTIMVIDRLGNTSLWID